MYLFQDRKLQSSTIDGYRSAIADKLGNLPINIGKDENLTRLLDNFPSWNPSLVLHQLTKVHFEAIKEASLKHLTFTTVFSWPWDRASVEGRYMLGKTEILDINLTGRKCPCTYYPAFSKNPLAKKGQDSVATGVITALTPTRDRFLKSDRFLCPFRALHYYLDRTSGRIRRWTKTSHLPLSPLASSRL